MPNNWSLLQENLPNAVAAIVVALVSSLLLTPLVIKVARSRGLVAHPSAERWHREPTALYGGIAIFCASLITSIFVLPFDRFLLPLGIGATLIFLIGLYDDFHALRPAHKLVAQLVIACLFVLSFFGTVQPPTMVWLVPLTIVWIIGITNAFNLLDNMDGLSSGVAALTALLMGIYALANGEVGIGLSAFIIAGAAAGFLVYNFNPARVFMGDCGSMFLGFSLACLSLMGRDGLLSGNLFSALLLPTLVLATPLFDTFFVSLMRFLNGRPISQGGRDHTSHRLVLLGLSERRAVLWLYAITLWFGLIGLFGALAQNVLATVAVTVLSASALLVLGLFLAEVQIYSEEEYDRARARLAGKKTVLTRVILHKRRLGEALFDFGAICACLIAAFLLRFEGHLPSEYAYRLSMALPYVVAAQMLSFHLLGMYRTLWRYATTSDILTAARGVVVGTLASFILIRFLSPLHPFPYSTLAIYAALLLIMITGTRLGLKAMRFHFALKWRDGSRRALIVGAGHAGELALHEMINNQALQLVPVGFLDDDPAKHQATIHGVRVLGTRSRLLEIVDRLKVDEVVIAMPSCRNGAVHEISQACREHQIGCREVRSIIMEHVTLNNISSPSSDSIKLS